MTWAYKRCSGESVKSTEAYPYFLDQKGLSHYKRPVCRPILNRRQLRSTMACSGDDLRLVSARIIKESGPGILGSTRYPGGLARPYSKMCCVSRQLVISVSALLVKFWSPIALLTINNLTESYFDNDNLVLSRLTNSIAASVIACIDDHRGNIVFRFRR